MSAIKSWNKFIENVERRLETEGLILTHVRVRNGIIKEAQHTEQYLQAFLAYLLLFQVFSSLLCLLQEYPPPAFLTIGSK